MFGDSTNECDRNLCAGSSGWSMRNRPAFGSYSGANFLGESAERRIGVQGRCRIGEEFHLGSFVIKAGASRARDANHSVRVRALSPARVVEADRLSPHICEKAHAIRAAGGIATGPSKISRSIPTSRILFVAECHQIERELFAANRPTSPPRPRRPPLACRAACPVHSAEPHCAPGVVTLLVRLSGCGYHEPMGLLGKIMGR
jgi:hypothetical protein